MTRRIGVERLLQWAFRDQRADKAPAPVDPRRYLSRPGSDWSGVADHGRLGTEIDKSAILADAVDPRARAVVEAVGRLGGSACALLREHGRHGGAPDWGGDLKPGMRPVFKDKVGPRYLADGTPDPSAIKYFYRGDHVGETLVGGPGKGKVRLGCRVMAYNPFSVIEDRRDDYAAWHRALTAIAAYFLDHPLDGFIVDPPSTSSAPWSDRTEKTGLGAKDCFRA
jgi:hypothetical protein